jgi:hypothetical protein
MFKRDDVHLNIDVTDVHLGQGVGKVKVYLETEQHKPATDQNDINVMITFTNARHNHNLQSKFRTSVTSMFKWTSSRLNIYIIGDSNLFEI